MWGERRWLTPPTLIGGVVLASVSFLNLNLVNVYNAAHPAAGALDQVTLGATLRLGETLRKLVYRLNVNEVYAGLPEPDLTTWSQRPLATISWSIVPDLIIVPLNRPAIYLRLNHGQIPDLSPIAQRVETIVFPGGDSAVFDVFPAMDRAAMLALPQTRLDWPTDTGRTFLGYTLGGDWRSGQMGTVTSYWLIERLPDNYTQFLYGPYLHLNAPDGAIVVNSSAPGIEGNYHRLGDLYIQPISVPIPADTRPGPYQLELGLYDGIHQAGTTFFPLGGIPQPFYTTTVSVEP
jgi:hypothetical protein